MGFFEGFLGKKEAPRPRVESDVVHKDFINDTKLTANGAVEWEQPKMGAIGQIINDVDRPRFTDRTEVPQANEVGIDWETPNVGAHLAVGKSNNSESLKQPIKYDNGIDYALVNKEVLAEIRNEQGNPTWDDGDARSVGDLRAQAKRERRD